MPDTGTSNGEKARDEVEVTLSIWPEDPITVHPHEVPVLRGQGLLLAVDGEPEPEPENEGGDDAAAPAANAGQPTPRTRRTPVTPDTGSKEN